MKLKELFDHWGLQGIKLNAGFAELDFSPKDPDRTAAWDLYVELLTRVATQDLRPEDGGEQSALSSIFSLFGLTRETLKSNGRHCNQFAKIAIVVLNQVVRPFTAKWHKRSIAGAFADPGACEEFRNDLSELQEQLRAYTRMLADMANVEDLTSLEQDD